MWIFIISTILIAYAAGIAMGSLIERGVWERTLDASVRHMARPMSAHARRDRFEVITGGVAAEPRHAAAAAATRQQAVPDCDTLRSEAA